jgi:hypothetical protein
MRSINKNIWTVVKSNKNISQSLVDKLKKLGLNISASENQLNFYCFSEDVKTKVIEVLSKYKNTSFQIVSFTDRQFGMTINSWTGYDSHFIQQLEKMPLKKRLHWFNPEGNRLAITPITQKQFDNMIFVN